MAEASAASPALPLWKGGSAGGGSEAFSLSKLVKSEVRSEASVSLTVRDKFVTAAQAKRGPGTLLVLGEVLFESAAENQPCPAGRSEAGPAGTARAGFKERAALPRIIVAGGCSELAEVAPRPVPYRAVHT